MSCICNLIFTVVLIYCFLRATGEINFLLLTLLPSWNKEFIIIIIIIIILGISIFIESNSIEKLVTFSWVF